MAWTGVCCLVACFVRSWMANTENEKSFKELTWPKALVSSSGVLEELGCISEFQHLAPILLPGFPSQGWYPIDNKLLGTRMFPRHCVNSICHTDP